MKSSFIPESLKGLFVSILVFSLGRIVSILFRPLDATECCNGPRVFSRFLGRKASSTAKPFDGELVDAIAKSAAPALRDCPQLHWELPARRNQRIVSKTIVDDHTVQTLISDIINRLWSTSDPPFSCPRDAFGWMCQEASLTDNELPDMFADPSLVQMATAAQAVPQDVLECTYADTPDSGFTVPELEQQTVHFSIREVLPRIADAMVDTRYRGAHDLPAHFTDVAIPARTESLVRLSNYAEHLARFAQCWSLAQTTRIILADTIPEVPRTRLWRERLSGAGPQRGQVLRSLQLSRGAGTVSPDQENTEHLQEEGASS